MTIERIEQKAWGTVEHLKIFPAFCIDLLHIKEGGYSSRHLHEHKSNEFIVIEGKLKIIHGNSLQTSWSAILIPNGRNLVLTEKSIHKFIALEDSQIIEIYRGMRCDKEDIIRFDGGGMLENGS